MKRSLNNIYTFTLEIEIQEKSLQKLDISSPRSVSENLMSRDGLLKQCDTDFDFRSDIYSLCSKDPTFWINLFAWSKDPKNPFDKIPFILYEDFQDEVVLKIAEAIESGHDLLIEKTREMGVSWMVLYVFAWFWLFRKNCDFRVGSRKEEFVDKIGDMDTLLEKIRFCLRYIPVWMLPKGYEESKHATWCKIINPATGNTIIGESANPHFGSGGRRKALLLDEFSKWDDSVASAAWTATADVTKCRIVGSTPA